MTHSQIKMGKWYDTELGVGVAEVVAKTIPPSVGIRIVSPFPRGLVYMNPRKVYRELVDNSPKGPEASPPVSA